MDKKLSNKKIIASASVLIVILLALFFVYHNFFPKGTEGEKNITVTVITPDHDPTEIKIKTNAEFLRQALDEKNLVQGTMYGDFLMVEEVNGIKAEEGWWWSLTKEGLMLETGVDSTPILDGDHYEFTLTEIN
ncbi:MAG TPA: DUF4430 domain-containing protein [Clostridiales bacterium]|nr:DUF4430 domain-containing protein [Clostridiales bacterium]